MLLVYYNHTSFLSKYSNLWWNTTIRYTEETSTECNKTVYQCINLKHEKCIFFYFVLIHNFMSIVYHDAVMNRHTNEFFMQYSQNKVFIIAGVVYGLATLKQEKNFTQEKVIITRSKDCLVIVLNWCYHSSQCACPICI